MVTLYYFDTLTLQELERACSVLVEELNDTPARRRPYTGIETEVKLADAWYRYRKAQQEADKALQDIVKFTFERGKVQA